MNTFQISTPAAEAELRVTPSATLSALNHPLRRSILRLLSEKGPATVTQMASKMSYVTRNNVRFHLDDLASRGIVRKDRPMGARESVYSPMEAARAQWVLTVLNLTAGED